MEEIYVKARAKINLTLEVLNKREDGYHNLRSIFQKINFYDELYIKKTDSNFLEFEINIPELDSKDNIIYKAYERLKEKYKKINGIKIKLNKKIPMQAGLAGGSTDAASFLFAMNKLFDLKMTKQEIENLGKDLGADVVPCMYNGAILGEGIGEIVTQINSNCKYYIVIIKPKISCNTKEAFKKIDEKEKIEQLDNSNKIIKALKENNLQAISNNLYNVFEDVIDNKELLKSIKNKFIEEGAKGSLLAGSGSCIFGLFENKKLAKKAYYNLKEKYETYICASYNSKRTYFDYICKEQGEF